MLRAVLDTNVLVSGLCRYTGSASYEIVSSLGNDWMLALTPAIFLEYEDVLKRSRIRRLTGLTPREVDSVLAYIADVGEQYLTYYSWRPNLIDESDNMFIECAVVSDAQYLVTGNKRHFADSELGPFRFEIVSPSQFLRLLK